MLPASLLAWVLRRRRRKSPITAPWVPFFGTILFISAPCNALRWYGLSCGKDGTGKVNLFWNGIRIFCRFRLILYERSYKSFIILFLQTPFQRLTLRMTRFYTSQPSAKVWNRLQHVMRNMGYDARTSADKVGSQSKPWPLQQSWSCILTCRFHEQSNMIISQ